MKIIKISQNSSSLEEIDRFFYKKLPLNFKIIKISQNSRSLKEIEKLFYKILPDSEFENKAFAVGGYVRDEVIGKNSKDLDIVIEIKGGSEKFTRWLKNKFPDKTTEPFQMGNYPIWSIHFKDNIVYQGEVYDTKGGDIEVADTMKESFPDKSSRQREVEHGSLQQDIERRDFTVNMLLKNLSSGEIVDLSGTSKSDIENGILRGHPNVDLNKTLSEDPLRIMRLIRFNAKYGWTIPDDVINIVKENAYRIEVVSSERIRDELNKLMEMGKLDIGIKMMKRCGLLKFVLPELHECIGVSQTDNRGHHNEGDVFDHIVQVLQNAKKGIIPQLAALCHDIGKPSTRKIIYDNVQVSSLDEVKSEIDSALLKITFREHDIVGSEIAEAILHRLKYPNKIKDIVINLVKYHMRPRGLIKANEKTLLKFKRELDSIHPDLYNELMDLARADALGKEPSDESYIDDLLTRFKSLPESSKEIKKPILNGSEIMQVLNIKPGPEIRKAIEFLIDLDDDYSLRGEVLTKEIAKIELIKNREKISN